MFEGWSEEKLLKYDIDVESYNHSDISSCTAILTEVYYKQRWKFLTLVHMWNKLSDGLFSSRYGPVQIRSNEVGMDANTTSVVTVSTVSSASKCGKRKNIGNEFRLQNIMNSVIDLCNNSRNEAVQNADKNKGTLIDQHHHQPTQATFGMIRR